MVDYQGDLRVFQDVADAAQAGEGGPLGFLVQSDVDWALLRMRVQGETYGNDVGAPALLAVERCPTWTWANSWTCSADSRAKETPLSRRVSGYEEPRYKEERKGD